MASPRFSIRRCLIVLVPATLIVLTFVCNATAQTNRAPLPRRERVRVRGRRMWLIARLLLLTAVVGLVCVGNAAAQTSDPDYALTGIGGSMQPDLFTGTASTSIPIQVPPGRHGIQPALSLQYWSGNGDGWLGPGWKLEVGAIQLQTRFGVNYSGDDYTFRLAGVSTDLVSIGSGEYRAKIEGGFSRVKNLTAGDGKPYWEATDKKGTRYLFGQTAASRQADPANAANIFKWCLDQVIDANGNYMTVTYFGDQGQGYIDHIDYTGNGATAPTNTVKFYLENRPDAPPMYTTNFLVTTAKRLKTIDVLANGNRVRTYKLSYTISSSTSRSMLSSVQQYGKDATLDGTGTVTGGTALPAVTFSWQGAAGGSFGSQYYSFGGIAGFDLLSTAERIVQLDYYGDGKSGIVLYRSGDGAIGIARSNGDGTFTGVYYSGSGIAGADLLSSYDRMFPFDYNGDGRADIAIYRPGSGFISVARSDGKGGFGSEYYSFSGIAGDDLLSVYDRILPLDYNGDGRADITAFRPGSGFITIARSNGVPSDLVASISNALAATTTIAYTPSTQHTNTQFPFPIQTVSSISTDDGNGNVSTSTYSFSGGFYHIGERDLRGFNYAKVTGPVGPNGEQTVSETWFHQGNDLEVDTNTPNVANGYMKGKPYRVRVSDGASHIYSEVTTSYASGPSTAPFFNPPLQVDTNICDGGACGKQTRTIYTFDTYGNVTREDQYGDLSDTSDDRTVSRTFSPNTTAWIVGLPSSETIYQGIGLANQMAATSFYYDGVTDCTVASSNVTPTLGNLTRVVRTLTGGVNPETRMAYDAYGNLICTRDANGNTTTMNYDGSFTFPKVVTNPLGHQKTTQYYGVDGVAADSGLYGQVKSVTDPNTAVITTTYDVFGRKLQVNFPDGGSTGTSYNSLRTVGSHEIQTNTQAGLSTLTYFDGLGRTITEKKTGPDAKTIAVQTQYNVRGAVLQTSLPYFFGIDAPSWKTFIYDPVGRVDPAINPGTSRVLSCTSNWVIVTIDPNNHRRRGTRDAYGRLAKVEEYTGTSSICDTSAGTPYATNGSQYHRAGTFRTVTYTTGKQRTIS